MLKKRENDNIQCGLAGDKHANVYAYDQSGEDNVQVFGRKKRDTNSSDTFQDRNVLRVIGGSNSVENSWPWQVWLSLFGGPYGSSLCGGSIISPRYFLTAAHCAPTPGITGTALMGSIYRNGDHDLDAYMQNTVDIHEIKPHPLYNKIQTFSWDFAMCIIS